MLLETYTSVQCWWADLRLRAREERGATAVEYAIMLAMIAAVVVGGVTLLGRSTNAKFSDFNAKFP